jgi:hypothetical protein
LTSTRKLHPGACGCYRDNKSLPMRCTTTTSHIAFLIPGIPANLAATIKVVFVRANRTGCWVQTVLLRRHSRALLQRQSPPHPPTPLYIASITCHVNTYNLRFSLPGDACTAVLLLAILRTSLVCANAWCFLYADPLGCCLRELLRLLMVLVGTDL